MTDYLDRLKTELAERHATGNELESGGMATVFVAEDLRHRRDVGYREPTTV